jgi:hypothetical protein
MELMAVLLVLMEALELFLHPGFHVWVVLVVAVLLLLIREEGQ